MMSTLVSFKTFDGVGFIVSVGFWIEGSWFGEVFRSGCAVGSVWDLFGLEVGGIRN